MTRDEQIISTAKQYYPYNINCHNAFLHGVEWADEHPINVWHDASEEPEDDFAKILYQEKIGTYGIIVKHDWDLVNISWEDFSSANLMSRWAYVEDLLPKGGEK